MDNSLRAQWSHLRHHRWVAARYHTLYHRARAMAAGLAISRACPGWWFRSASPGRVVISARKRKIDNRKIDIYSQGLRLDPLGVTDASRFQNTRWRPALFG